MLQELMYLYKLKMNINIHTREKINETVNIYILNYVTERKCDFPPCIY